MGAARSQILALTADRRICWGTRHSSTAPIAQITARHDSLITGQCAALSGRSRGAGETFGFGSERDDRPGCRKGVTETMLAGLRLKGLRTAAWESTRAPPN